MDLRIVYITEKDLNDQLVEQLKNISFEDVRVLFFVELGEVDYQLLPMISDVANLRLRKAERRINKWLEEGLDHINHFEVLTFNGRPTKTNPNYTLTLQKNQELNVLLSPEHEPRIAPYLNQHAGAHQIKYLSLGDFSGEDMNL